MIFVMIGVDDFCDVFDVFDDLSSDKEVLKKYLHYSLAYTNNGEAYFSQWKTPLVVFIDSEINSSIKDEFIKLIKF